MTHTELKTAAPFSWVVRFTVAPLWVQDGFALSDDLALSMLARELPSGTASELSASVLEAPPPGQIARMRGYDNGATGRREEKRDLLAGTPSAGKIHRALLEARALLGSVEFVSEEGDSDDVLWDIDEALELINTRQGKEVSVGSIISAIKDDIEEYERLCRIFDEEVRYKQGEPDCYGEHARALYERWQDRLKVAD